MNKNMDFFLAKVLNQWVAKHRPPTDGRERLLQKAVAPLNQSTNKFALSWLTGQGAFNTDIIVPELSRMVSGWIYMPLQPGKGNLSIA